MSSLSSQADDTRWSDISYPRPFLALDLRLEDKGPKVYRIAGLWTRKSGATGTRFVTFQHCWMRTKQNSLSLHLKVSTLVCYIFESVNWSHNLTRTVNMYSIRAHILSASYSWLIFIMVYYRYKYISAKLITLCIAVCAHKYVSFFTAMNIKITFCWNVAASL
jgi:hypothetical protein